jgi:hypothetical protein
MSAVLGAQFEIECPGFTKSPARSLGELMPIAVR